MTVSKEAKSIVTTSSANVPETLDFEAFHAKSHFWGRLTIWGVILLTLLLPLYLSFVLGFHPGWSAILSGFLAYAAVIAAVWVIEPISYYPILGVSGTYLAFLNGNIGNMCLPSASIAQATIGAEPGTKKGELAATLAISAAAIVNTTVLIFVVLGGSIVISLLPTSFVEAFRFVLPAVYGGVIAQFAIKKPVWGIVGVAFGLFVNLGPVPRSLQTFLCILGTVAACMLLEKIKTKKAGS
ncbi:small-conductance mechanosensitive channel [Sporosarcina sp. Marseille-Q4943]|uniref:small-conductance mechanosensitive channel n=1 Tax=Sporosarcina sp. Marseille-Q4943 TaxID=2942204 RepID=UPI00208DA8B8|nr:small-conductance mechanosensitive channel [Sporosarcina sp. Marseille-Q4943]